MNHRSNALSEKAQELYDEAYKTFHLNSPEGDIAKLDDILQQTDGITEEEETFFNPAVTSIMYKLIFQKPGRNARPPEILGLLRRQANLPFAQAIQCLYRLFDKNSGLADPSNADTNASRAGR